MWWVVNWLVLVFVLSEVVCVVVLVMLVRWAREVVYWLVYDIMSIRSRIMGNRIISLIVIFWLWVLMSCFFERTLFDG